MPTLNIDGVGRVQVDDSFKMLTPEQQESTVNEIIAASKGRAKATSPTTILDTPQHFQEMRREAQNQIGEGIGQLKSGFGFATTPTAQLQEQYPEGMTPADQFSAGPGNLAKGAGNIAGGVAGLAWAPIGAAIRSTASKPLEERTGIPKEYTEFATGLGLPIPKRIPLPSKARPVSSEEVLGVASEQYKTLPGNEILRPAVAPKTSSVLEEIGIKAPEPASRLEALIDARRSLHDLKVSPDLTERAAAGRGLSLIDKEIEAIDPGALAKLREADANWAAGKTLKRLERQEERATTKAASPTGPTPDTAMRQRARAILDNDKARLGLTPDEIERLEKINAGTYSGNAAGWLASLLRGQGSAKTILQATMVAPAAARGLEAIAGKITSNQWSKLEKAVVSRSPHGKAVEASTKAWSEAKEAFELDPSVKAFVKLSIASGNLANTAKAGGVSIDPNSLLRSIQGTVRGSAEGEEPEPERVFGN